MRLIDADALLDRMYKYDHIIDDEITDLVRYALTLDVSPAVHAHWIRKFLAQTGCYECSNCGRYSTLDTNYCGSCRARMDGMDEVYGREKLNQIQNLIFNQKLN